MRQFIGHHINCSVIQGKIEQTLKELTQSCCQMSPPCLLWWIWNLTLSSLPHPTTCLQCSLHAIIFHPVSQINPQFNTADYKSGYFHNIKNLPVCSATPIPLLSWSYNDTQLVSKCFWKLLWEVFSYFQTGYLAYSFQITQPNYP